MRFLRTFLAGSLVVTAALTVPPSAAGTVASAAAAAVPAMWTESAYASVFTDSGRSPEAGDRLRLDTAKNDHEAAQVVLRSPQAFTVTKVDFTDLVGPSDTIGAAQLSYDPVGHQSLNHPSHFAGQPIYPQLQPASRYPGLFPDRLLNDDSIAVPANTSQSIWVRVHVPAAAAGGVYSGRVTVRTSAGDLSVPITVNARDVVIPPANQSEFTNVLWTNFLGLTSYDPGKGDTVKLFYDHDRYSAGWWQLIDNWADTMKRYRQNNLQLPLLSLLRDGGSKVDAAGNYTFNFSRFDEVAQRFLDKGVVHTLEGFTGAGPQTRERNSQYPKYLIEVIPKVASQPVPDYVWYDAAAAENWYQQFYPALRQHLVQKGWLDKFWIHVGDEPGAGGDPGWFAVKNKVKQYFPEARVGDAIVNALAPAVAKEADIVIPNTHTYTADPAPYDAERAKGKPLWIYNCNIPVGNHLNRFIDQPQWHQRQTMWFAYGRGATGYLHWAYNNWQYAMDNQGPKGDGYIVRPDKARNTLEMTTRYESLRDGMEDWEVLNKLGKTNPGLAKDLARSVAQRSDKYTPDVSHMQRMRVIALDAAAGKPVAKDLARAKAASASTQQAGSEASKAVDGDPATGWQPTTGTGTQWMQVDLGRQGLIDGVRLRWDSTYAKNYRVLTSLNGTTWAPAGTGAGDGQDDFVGVNGKARYIRVEATTSSGSATPYRLLELEVAGNLLLQQNIAGGKAYERTTPSSRFPDSGREATDGIIGDDWGDGRSFGYELTTAGQRVRAEVKIDLGYQQMVGTARIHAYEDYPDYRPDMITVATSTDGVNFTERGLLSWVNGASKVWYDVGFAPVPARWVKVLFDKARNTDRQTGLFVDEVEVYSSGPGGPDNVPGATAYQWNEPGGPGHQVAFAPSATGTMRRWDWSPTAGLKTADWGGGPIAGKTTGYAWNNQQHAVARSTGGSLLHWWWIHGEANPHYGDWGGDAAGDPAAAVWAGQQHVFARSSTGALTHWWWDPADSQLRIDAWKGAPGPIVGTPSAYVWGNQLHVVARGANNHLYHWWWGLGDFEPSFADWGGEAYSDPTTFVWNGQQHVYAQAASGQLYHWYWDAGEGLRTVVWGGAPGRFTGAPSAFKDQYQQHVVARGPSDTLYHWWWDQRTGKVTWEDLGGQAHSDPVAFAFADQHQFFAQSGTNTLYHWWWTPQDGWHRNDWGGSVKYPG